MHDIDRTQLEFEADADEFEADRYEYAAPYAASSQAGETGVFGEAEEMELAAELLASGDEQELDQFIGKLIGQAGELAGQPVKGRTASKLGGFLKGALKKALPMVAGAAGTLLGGPLGGAAAGKLASAAGKAFGLELEGLSPEDQEFEAARRFVRLAGEATKQAGRAAQVIEDPQAAARKALTVAARRHAPGLLAAAAAPLQRELSAPAPAPRGERPGQSGRWMRQGDRIVLFGL